MTHSASTLLVVFICSTWQAWGIPPSTDFHHQWTSAQSPKASLLASLALTWCLLRHDVETKQQVSTVKHSYISDCCQCSYISNSCQLLFKHNSKRFHSWATQTTCNFQSFSSGTHDVRHSVYLLKFSALLILRSYAEFTSFCISKIIKNHSLSGLFQAFPSTVLSAVLDPMPLKKSSQGYLKELH